MICRKEKVVSERELFIQNYIKYVNNQADFTILNETENTFYDDAVDDAWVMWQLSANRQGYNLVPVEPSENQWSGLARHLGRYMQMNDRYCPKTLKKYFDRFIGEPPEWLTNEVSNWDSEHAFATADLPVFIYKAMIGACDD